MPLPLAAVIAGANVAGGIFNTISQGVQNRKNRKWAEKRYNIERADALHDWHMQNAYNSPEQQMSRLKAAGLNPHLVYGTGADATAQGSVKNVGTQTPDTGVPQFQFDAMNYIDAAVKQAQVNNVDASTKVAEEQRALVAAQVTKTIMDTHNANLDYETKKQLQEYQVNAAKLGNEQLKQRLDMNKQEMRMNDIAIEIADRTREQKVELAIQDVLQKRTGIKLTQQQIAILERDQELKDMEIALRKKGGNPNDPAYQKYIVAIIVAIVKKLGYNMEDLLK